MTTAILEEIIGCGEKLKLMDGSIWAIDPADMPTVITWLPTATIRAAQNKDQAFNCTLTNESVDISVKAMKLPLP